VRENNLISTAEQPSGKSYDRITVVGYGGCMVKGYPMSEEASFMRLAAAGAQGETGAEIELKIFGRHACPATQAMEHLEEEVCLYRPDIVVLQFGQSDAKIPLKRLWNETFGLKRASSGPSVAVSEKPMTRRGRIKTFLRACGGLIVRAQPFTSRADYRRSIAEVVEAVVATGAYAIVLTPFVFDNFLADAWAHCYSYDLESDFAGRTDVCVINVWSLLAEYPRAKMLLHDGLHLSRSAHAVLAESLQACLVERIRSRASAPLVQEISGRATRGV
jgi:lysophospholipase L1-like esterase